MKIIKEWKDFILEYKEVNKFLYGIFDWDDNILIIETPLHF